MKNYGKVTPDDQASGSMLPAILGISEYQSQNDALQTCMRAIDGLEREDISNESMSWGNEFEGRILVRAAERLGLDNLNLDHEAAYHHKTLPLAVSLDGTADGKGLVIENDPDQGIYVMGAGSIKLDGVGIMEAKLTASEAEDAPPLHRGPVQLQAQMDCFGATWGAVCTLYKGTRLRIFLFERHQGTLDLIAQAVADFQRRLDIYRGSKVIEWYPPKDSADANRMFPVGADDEPVYLGEEEDFWAHEILRCKAEIKKLEDNLDDAEKKLKEILGEKTCGITGKYEIYWPMRHYAAQPEKITPAKEARVVRQSTLKIKVRK